MTGKYALLEMIYLVVGIIGSVVSIIIGLIVLYEKWKQRKKNASWGVLELK